MSDDGGLWPDSLWFRGNYLKNNGADRLIKRPE